MDTSAGVEVSHRIMNAEEQEKYILSLVNQTPPSSAPLDDNDIDSDDIDSSSGIDDDSDDASKVTPARLSPPCAHVGARGSPSSDASTISPSNSPVESTDRLASGRFWTPAPCASSGFDSDETVSPGGITPPVSDGEIEIVQVDMRGIAGWESDRKKQEEKRAEEKKVLRGRARIEARQRAIARARAEAAAGESSDDGSLPVYESPSEAVELPKSANAFSKPRRGVDRRKAPKAKIKVGRRRGGVSVGDGATSDEDDCTERRVSDIVMPDEIERAIDRTRRRSRKNRKFSVSDALDDDLGISSDDDDDVVIKLAKPRRRVAASKPTIDNGKTSSDVIIRRPKPRITVAACKSPVNDLAVRSDEGSPKANRPRRRVAAPQPLVSDLHESSDDGNPEVKRPKPRRKNRAVHIAGTAVKSKPVGNKKTSTAKAVTPIEESATEPAKRKTAFGARARVRV